MIAPRLALIGILFSTLFAFHECSKDAGIMVEGEKLKTFINPIKCIRVIFVAAKCWRCGSKLAKICWTSLRSCRRHCRRSPPPPPPYSHPKYQIY
ncbi:hypothetical protein ACP275_08G042900 [Erythranthe tilingii]